MSDRPTILILIEPKFPLGELVVTPGALAALTPVDINSGLNLHLSGDWGDLDEEDWRANDRALKHGERLLSAYESERGGRYYIITEWDRSCSTILLPEEY